MKKVMSLTLSILLTGLTLSAQDQDRDRIRQRDRIYQEDHLRLLDGKLYLYKQGTPSQVQAQIKLNNGAVVNPDGSYQLLNQQRHQLRNGECMDYDGNRYLNQNRFNRRNSMSYKQMDRIRSKNIDRNGAGRQSSARRGGGSY